jgi:7-cyano-7-deazaguanine synthase
VSGRPQQCARRTCGSPITDVLPQWSSRLGDDHLLSIPVLAEISETALTSETAIALLETGLPNTFLGATCCS